MTLIWKRDLEADERPEQAGEHEVPVLIRATLTPASLAPSWLPPVATVCSPPGPGEQDLEDGREDDREGDLGRRVLADPLGRCP